MDTSSESLSSGPSGSSHQFRFFHAASSPAGSDRDDISTVPSVSVEALETAHKEVEQLRQALAGATHDLANARQEGDQLAAQVRLLRQAAQCAAHEDAAELEALQAERDALQGCVEALEVALGETKGLLKQREETWAAEKEGLVVRHVADVRETFCQHADAVAQLETSHQAEFFSNAGCGFSSFFLCAAALGP